MNIKSILLVISISFILTSCKSYILSEKASNSVLNNEKALVVFTAIADGYHNAGTVWKDVNKKDIFIPTSENIIAKGLWDNILYVYTVPPGEYTLTDIMLYAFHVGYAYNTETTSEISTNNLMSFSVSKGEVIYLGNIVFNFDNDQVVYKVSDQFQKIQKEAEKIFPKLHYRLQKRIIPPQAN